jgi:threonylcarbamoyladenosine tRNA methylthiotransferase MtaB
MSTPIQSKRACVHTLGCRLNQAETALLVEKLVHAGYSIVPFGEPAQLGIIHTCTVTQEADTKSRKLVRQFIRKNPEAYTAVIGCYAQMGAQAIAEIEGVDLIVGNQEKLQVLDYVAAGKNDAPVIVRDQIIRDDFTIGLTSNERTLEDRANLKIQDGCDYMCSFCVIPFARGRARSRDLGNLRAEARQLVERGAKELVLSGVNIGTYSWQGQDITDVVDALNELDGLARIRISSIEPTTIPEALFDRMADAEHALVPYLHIPMQAGNDRVLAAMRRKYTRQEWLSFVEEAAARVPGLGVGTDILVGFPGETDADFEDTLALFSESPAFYAHVFKYSERTGTASARMEGKVPPQIMNVRSASLRTCSAAKQRKLYEAHEGQAVEVLFENKENGSWTGYTGNFIRVAVEAGENLRNKIRRVTLGPIRGDLLTGRITR